MKILSIDFNYIMYSCIKLYNHLCNNDVTDWDFIENELNIEKFFCYDGDVLKQLAKLIRSNLSNGAKMYPIEHHKDIVNIIKELDSEKVDITNIDWSCDIVNSSKDLEMINSFNLYDNTNWINYLCTLNKLNSYTWVKAPNSQVPVEDMIKLLNIPFDIKNKMHISELANDYDIICVSFSPTQVPYKYKHLFDLITIE